MPGLVGVVSRDPGDEQLLHRMTDSIRHKLWQWIDNYIEFPFYISRVHLRIFNPEPQPICNEDKSLSIFMYGKIHGYEEKMKELKKKHFFLFGNDPEFCLHAYEEWGEVFVKELNGHFVLAICDHRHKRLLIINDRFGLTPLYYAICNNRLLFGSEVKAILQDGKFRRELNENTVADFFGLGVILGNKTFFKGIEVLSPASILTYDGENVSIKKYWDYDYEPDYRASENDLLDQLIESFSQSIKIRMNDDLRYGILLSGGLDSRSVLGGIRKRREDIITITFGVQGSDDVRIAEAVSKVACTNHMCMLIDPNEVLTPYPEQIVRFTDGMQPIYASFILPVYEKVKAKVDVLTEGLALDLLLGGSFLRRKIFSLKNDADLMTILIERYKSSIEFMAKLFADDYYNMIKHIPLRSIESSLPKEKWHPCNKWDYIMLQNHVRRLTFMGFYPIVQNMMEVIVPTYDNNFIDTILRIPPELRFRNYIYRKFLKRFDPELAKILNNHTMIRSDMPLLLWRAGEKIKNGKERFKKIICRISNGRIYLPDKRRYAPVGEWLRTNDRWKQFSRDVLLNKNAYFKEYFKQKQIETLIYQHQSGKADHEPIIEYLITFELFLKDFVEGKV
mgnify:CR=1 FL=1